VRRVMVCTPPSQISQKCPAPDEHNLPKMPTTPGQATPAELDTMRPHIIASGLRARAWRPFACCS
jgi:hypothetical protein